MQLLYKWFVGDLGTPGRFEYKAVHLYSVLGVTAALALVIALAIRFRENRKSGEKLLLTIAWFHLGFEVLWRLLYLFVKGDPLPSLWPLFPCNLGGILLPVFAITGCRTGKRMFYLFGFVGALITFGYPDGIYNRNVLTFPILKSVLQHTGLLMIPAVELILGSWRPRLKDMGWVMAGCLIHLINCEGITRLLGFTGDYMFLRSGLPFVIPGVPGWITMSVFATAVLTVLSWAGDKPGKPVNV